MRSRLDASPGRDLTQDTDGECRSELLDLLKATEADVDEFWTDLFEPQGWDANEPPTYVNFTSSVETGCGNVAPNEGDVENAIVALSEFLGDPANTDSADASSHGPGSLRTWWFLRGYYQGASACLEQPENELRVAGFRSSVVGNY